MSAYEWVTALTSFSLTLVDINTRSMVLTISIELSLRQPSESKLLRRKYNETGKFSGGLLNSKLSQLVSPRDTAIELRRL